MNTSIRQFSTHEIIILKARCKQMTAFYEKYKRIDKHPEFYDYEYLKRDFWGISLFARKFSDKAFWDKLERENLAYFFGYATWSDYDEVKTTRAYDKLTDLVDLLECSCTVSLDSQTAKMIGKIL